MLLHNSIMLRYLLFGFVLVLPNVFADKFRFDNYTLYKIIPKGANQLKLLQNLQDNDLRYDFWTDPVPSAPFVNILSSPGNKGELESFMKSNGMDFEITMSNIQEAIDKEVVSTYTRNNARSMEWDRYYKLDDIYAWIDDLAAAYPNIVTVLIGGSTIEGRKIKGLRISHGAGKRVIFLEGGIHSREWISPATVNFITNELLTSNDPDIQAAAHEFDWYIFPVTNPDGYVWSHESALAFADNGICLAPQYTANSETTNRMWRKNRRPVGNQFGIDLNRNWNNNWLVAGTSSNPAADNYAGLGPFSEPETRTLSTFITSIGDRIDLYLSFHSFSELLLIPFGNTTEPVANYHDALNIGRRAMGALSVRYGTLYTTGNIAEAIYQATGGSVDWVKEFLGVPLVYCYELRDKGTFGFVLPTDQILPNNLEVMDSVLDLIYQAKRFGYMNGNPNTRANSAFGVQGSSLMILLVLVSRYFLN